MWEVQCSDQYCNYSIQCSDKNEPLSIENSYKLKEETTCCMVKVIISVDRDGSRVINLLLVFFSPVWLGSTPAALAPVSQ